MCLVEIFYSKNINQNTEFVMLVKVAGRAITLAAGARLAYASGDSGSGRVSVTTTSKKPQVHFVLSKILLRLINN